MIRNRACKWIQSNAIVVAELTCKRCLRQCSETDWTEVAIVRSRACSLRPTIQWTTDHPVGDVHVVAGAADGAGDALCYCCSNQQRSLIDECHFGVSEQMLLQRPPPMVHLTWV